MYQRYLKRVLDFLLAVLALAVLAPLLGALTVCGAAAMRGNPFFVQERPGKDEKIFRLIKFRTMSDQRDAQGQLLPDAQRLNCYGRILRRTSLDELPQLWNIVRGEMAIVGPRPLSVRYLPFYNEAEKHRHDVRPGLTGLAQIHGRNAADWPQRFAYDRAYVQHITLRGDVRIILATVRCVLCRQNIAVRGTTNITDFSTFRMRQWEAERENTTGQSRKQADRIG